jgi:hypothetical protein
MTMTPMAMNRTMTKAKTIKTLKTATMMMTKNEYDKNHVDAELSVVH